MKKLTASELGDLFANYVADSLFLCVFDHQLQIVQDDSVQAFLEDSKKTSTKHLKRLRKFFTKENIPVPIGFGVQDVRRDAPRLFSDIFIVFYSLEMAKSALLNYGISFSNARRDDVAGYFKVCLDDSIHTFEKASRLLYQKDVGTTTPLIPYPKQVDFVKKDSFLSILTSKNRPLTALEIKHLYLNASMHLTSKAITLGFSQVASSDKLRKYFQKSSDMADEQTRSFSKFLANEHLPSPSSLEDHVTDSTIPPFSDKLMMYQVGLLNGIGIANYGSAFSQIMRHDLHAEFALLLTKFAKNANEGMNLTIENGWLEEPPTAVDRKNL